MRAFLVPFVATGLALAGCSSSPEETGPAPTPPASQYEDDAVNVTVPVLPREAPAPGERTTQAAPQWRLGEWWKYRMTDQFTGTQYEFLRVVAGEDREAGNYLVGFPVDEFSNDVMVFHIPGYGDIRQADLGYETHDALFQPLRFPLREGDEWPVSFEGVANGTAQVVRADNASADIAMQVSAYGSITATYDAQMGEIAKLSIAGYADYEVIGHGFGYEGVVRVPHDHDLVFFHGRYLGVHGVSDPLVSPSAKEPTETVEISSEYDRLSFTIILGPGALGLGDPTGQGVPVPGGYFAEKVTAPDQTVYELAMLPSEGSLKIAFYGAEMPGGTWTLEHTAVGAGAAFVEGIGYHSIDIELPTGCVLVSLNAAHHDGPCKVQQAGGEPIPA